MHDKIYSKYKCTAYIIYCISASLKIRFTHTHSHSPALFSTGLCSLCFVLLFNLGRMLISTPCLVIQIEACFPHAAPCLPANPPVGGGTEDHPIIENNLEYLFMSPSPILEDLFQQLQF